MFPNKFAILASILGAIYPIVDSYGGDLDAISQSCIVSMQASQYDPNHHWAENEGGYCISFLINGGSYFGVQLYFTYTGSEFYYRCKWGSWLEWKRVALIS